MRMLGLALLLLATGCSEKPRVAGTNTHWLRACATAADCGNAGTCVCGICTSECTDDAECSPGACGSELTSTCRGTDASSICVPVSDDGACTELEVPRHDQLSATGATPTCATPGALLCEAFDGPLPAGYATWGTDTMTAAIQDCLTFQGAGALRYQAATFGYVQSQMPLSTPVASGPLYARFYAYLPSFVHIPTYFALFELWHLEGSSDGKISVEVISDDRLELQVLPNESTHAAAVGSMPRDQWACIELGLDVAATGGAISLSVDGSTVIDQTDVATLPAGPFSIAVVEALPAEDVPSAELTIDELVVATEPIGCL